MRADFVLGGEYLPASSAGILPGLVEILQVCQHCCPGSDKSEVSIINDQPWKNEYLPEPLPTLRARDPLAWRRDNMVPGTAGLPGLPVLARCHRLRFDDLRQWVFILPNVSSNILSALVPKGS